MRKRGDALRFGVVLDTIESALDFPWSVPRCRLKCARRSREKESHKERKRRRDERRDLGKHAGGESKRKTLVGRGDVGGEDNPVRARWNENAVTRNKRGGDPKLLVEVQPEGLGMSLRRGGDETLP